MKWTTRHERILKEQWLDKPTSQIARELGVARETAQYHARRIGLPSKRGRHYHNTALPKTKITILVARGLTIQQIAKSLNRDRSILGQRLREQMPHTHRMLINRARSVQHKARKQNMEKHCDT